MLGMIARFYADETDGRFRPQLHGAALWRYSAVELEDDSTEANN